MWWSGRGSCILIALCVKRCPWLPSTLAEIRVSPHAIDAMVCSTAPRECFPPHRHAVDATPSQARPPRDVLVRRD